MFSKIFVKLHFSLLLSIITVGVNAHTNLSDDAIADLLIQKSINSYSGRCSCPYNVMKNGKACGGRSAYSKPGGKSPLCYRRDVSVDMIKQWRSQNKK